jgi:hypothetical protein
MQTDVARNLRLVAATTLLSLWGFTHLAATPVLGDTILPLLVALLIAPGSVFGQWVANRAGVKGLIAALLALVAITLLLYGLGSEQELLAFSHSPYFVLPVWALGLFGLVRNATSAERFAAPVRAASGAAHAMDADSSGARPRAEGAAPE